VRGCFPLWKRTRHMLGLAFASHLRTELVRAALQTLNFEVPEVMVHRDQGTPFGAQSTHHFLLEKDFQLSMSRAGTPMDNGSAERFVDTLKLVVAERCHDETLGAFLKAAELWVHFYHTIRSYEGLEYLSPEHSAREHGLPVVVSRILDTGQFATAEAWMFHVKHRVRRMLPGTPPRKSGVGSWRPILQDGSSRFCQRQAVR
jgi:hypothetical protein